MKTTNNDLIRKVILEEAEKRPLKKEEIRYLLNTNSLFNRYECVLLAKVFPPRTKVNRMVRRSFFFIYFFSSPSYHSVVHSLPSGNFIVPFPNGIAESDISPL